MMAKYSVIFGIGPPKDATLLEVSEWVEFCVGHKRSISQESPLNEYDLEHVNRVEVKEA